MVFKRRGPACCVKGAMLSKFRNAGQTCVCAGSKCSPLSMMLSRRRWRSAGDGFESGVAIGPTSRRRPSPR
ncbi:hypothetical protein [Mesorhizobium silamurunense]|uniref:hypothetical protein n=1 Tax=Mesorhizobium silamurunense TaxID=499528 RepID=UPI003CCEEC25